MTTRRQRAIDIIREMPDEAVNKLLDIIDPLIKYGEHVNGTGEDQQPNFMGMLEFGSLTRSVVGGFTYAIIVNAQNGIYAVDPEDTVVGKSLRFTGSYSSNEVKRIEELVNADSRVLVVGAHIGTLVVPIAKIVEHVTAIEANPDTFLLLELNLALNDLENCRAINIAAGDAPGVINFLQNRINSGGSKRKPLHDDIMYYYDSPKEINIAANALDQLLANEQYDLIIMDLEGSEYFALKGMTAILEKTKMLIIEFVPHHLKNVSGVTVEMFLGLLDTFRYLTIPSLDVKLPVADCLETLKHMYDNDYGDDGLIFEK